MGMSYGKYVAYRLINAAIVLFLAVLLMSALFTKLADEQLSSQASQAARLDTLQYSRQHHLTPSQINAYYQSRYEYYREKYGLDKPYYRKTWDYTINTLKFDWGKSLYPLMGTKNVREQIRIALPRTILLFTTSQIIIILIGIALGVKSAQNPGSLLDRTISILAMVTTSLPMWWLGMLMILVFVVSLNLLPINLYATANFNISTKHLLEKMTLPLATIVIVAFGGWAWTIRNIMIGTLQEDFIMVARAKGVPENRVIYGHALKASAPPIITMIIFGMLASLGGAIITEIVFNWPGMGFLYWEAITYDAVRTLMAENYIFAILTVFSMVLADLLYAWLDPRVRVGAAARA